MQNNVNSSRKYSQRAVSDFQSNNMRKSWNRSFGSVSSSPSKKKITSNNIMLLEKLSEYILELSLLIFELQKFSASVVTSAWILSARKIMKIQPLWNKNLEKMTNYSYDSLIKCSNIILSNYNNLKIGNAIYTVEKSFRPHLVKYEHSPLEDLRNLNKQLGIACSMAVSTFGKLGHENNTNTQKRISSNKVKNSPADEEWYSSVHFSETSVVNPVADIDLWRQYNNEIIKHNFKRSDLHKRIENKRSSEISIDKRIRNKSDR